MGTWRTNLLAINLALLMSAAWVGTGLGQATQPQSLPATQPTRAVVISLEGVIDDYSRDALFKRFDEARKLGAKVVILKLNTPGGLVTAGLDISRFLKLQDDLHIVAFVDEKAYSAGIMVGLACDEIVMEPGSYIGDSAPIAMSPTGGLQKLEGAERAKAESPILADFHDSAVRNGYDPLLAEAMVSYARVVHWVEYVGTPSTAPTTSPAASPSPGTPGEASGIGDRPLAGRGEGSSASLAQDLPPNALPEYREREQGAKRRFVNADQFAKLSQEGWRHVSEPGVPVPLDAGDTLLTVSADVARKVGLSKATVLSPQSLAAERGYTIAADLAPGGGEKFVALLSSAAVRGMLLTIFMLSLYVALHTPGAGGAETIALISLGLLIGVPLLTGYAQWWEIALVVVGLCLIAVELFLIPGFGVAGITGIALLLGGLVMTFVGNAPGLPGTWRLPQIWTGVQNGLLAVVIAFAVSGMLAVWLRKYLPSLPYVNRLVLRTSAVGAATSAAGTVPGAAGVPAPADAWPFVGTIGRAVSDLKPGGSAEFPFADDRRITAVVSDGGYVPAGTKLSVREVHGNRVVVRPIA